MAMTLGRNTKITLEYDDIEIVLKSEPEGDDCPAFIEQMLYEIEFTVDFPPTKQNLIFFEILTEKDGRYN